ncbi:ATP-binding response regulator [Silvibacterium acidisoli]|uniref:ATP-binding response regulator n=1 Tax=Acidobacteriaceae bacterium ZG23-2 TaxID=2883246 RepID=UPI00406BF36F
MGSSNTLEKQYLFLHLEDNPLDAELTVSRLSAAGISCGVTVVSSRTAFEEAFANGSFDLVLADYSLPDFDGLAALKIVRQISARIPFIFVSGVLGEDVAVETLLSGATDYVIKQKMDRLVPAVLRALSEHEEYKSRQRAEVEAREGEERFKKLTNSLPAMVWTCDLEGRLTYTNLQWDRNVGGAKLWCDPEIIHASDLEVCEALWSGAQKQQEPFEVDCRFRMRNGEYRWNLVWAAPIHNDKKQVTGWVGTCTDTEQQRFRDAQFRTAEKLALTGRMASVIAHEINNPLEAMTNLFYLLRNEVEATEKGQVYFSQVEHELLRISTITKLTLQWSREGGMVTRQRAVSLVDETLRLFQGKLANRNIHLDREIEDVEFFAVGGEIRQVLANLLSNAIDAVDLGGHITLGARSLQRDGIQFVELSVQDDGAGIEPERLPALFGPFHSTKGALGNGLGLYISKEIVDRHGGQLIPESTVGLGTTMRVLLPANQPGTAKE